MRKTRVRKRTIKKRTHNKRITHTKRRNTKRTRGGSNSVRYIAESSGVRSEEEYKQMTEHLEQQGPE